MAGNTSFMSVMSTKMAVKASSCGNIWTRSNVSRPVRRPLNRIRENAYAASADRNVCPMAAAPAMIIVLRNQLV